MGALFLTLATACPRVVVAPVSAPLPRPELWVDAFAAPGGDGSREHPLKAPPRSLVPRTTVHLASGIYNGPFEFTDDVELVGTGTAVLSLETAGTVVKVNGATLSHVVVRGGDVAVLVDGSATARALTVSGFKTRGVEVSRGANFTCTECVVEGTIPQTEGISSAGQLTLTRSKFSGPLKRAVAVSGGSALLQTLQALGPATVIHATGSKVTASEVTCASGTGTAVLVSEGSLNLTGLQVNGFEAGLRALHAEVDLRQLKIQGAITGISLERSRGSLTGVHVERSGTPGAIVALDSTLVFDDVSVNDAQALGLFIRKGSAKVRHVQVSRVRREGGSPSDPDLGDGLHLREAKVELADADVSDVEGSALYASNYAEVVVKSLTAARTGSAAVVADVNSSLEVDQLVIQGAHGPGLLLVNQGHAHVKHLAVSGVEAAIWADCDASAWAQVDVLKSDLEPTPSRCVRLGPAPR